MKELTIAAVYVIAMREDIKLIIIPDTHGRSFWKEAVSGNETVPVVFLGDYLDPYGFECISNSEAWNNFMDIVNFKTANPDRVHLLLGNHDCGYLDRNINECRRDSQNAMRNQRFFRENIALFDMVYEVTVSDRRLLLSHAGVNRKWYEWHFGKKSDFRPDVLNDMLHGDRYEDLMRILADVSGWRGGDSGFGSIVWADICEFREEGTALEGITQIVGHTMLGRHPFLAGNGDVFCIDCKRAFALTDEGKIVEVD